MKFIIGFWLICLAITLFVLSFEPSMTFKEKVATGCGFMLFLTVVFIGAWFMVGSEV